MNYKRTAIPNYTDLTGRQIYTGDVYSFEVSPDGHLIDFYFKCHYICLWIADEYRYGWVSIHNYDAYQDSQGLYFDEEPLELALFFNGNSPFVFEGNIIRHPEMFRTLITA